PLEELEFFVDSGEHLNVGVQDLDLYAIPEAGWSGEDWISVEVVDRCDQSAEITFDLGVGAMANGDCVTTFTYTAQGSPTAVYLAGTFNSWAKTAMEDLGDGTWTLEVPLAEGVYAYKLVEESGSEQWTCDPAATAFQCGAGYDPNTWSDCSLGATSCNSLVVVGDCNLPTLSLDTLDIDRTTGEVSLLVRYVPGDGGQAIGSLSATLDGTTIAQAAGWTGEDPLSLSLTGLTPTRHTVRISASDTASHAAEALYVPFWTDDLTWDRGLLYYVFVDRFANGEAGNDLTYGASHYWTDYMGGDWDGVIDHLDYLEDLGVTALWLTAPVDNASGVWGSKCGADFTGYHGYWPSSAFGVEEHFGDEALLHELIDEAHARNMRVVVDWVGNHVHTQHPYYADHPGWYNPQQLCNDANNWDDIPETCWFDSFLPDIDYYQPEPLVQMVDDAVAMVKEYGFDGYRVDAVKHMPHSVYYNFQSRVLDEVEHAEAGGDEDFYTVGETFDGDRTLIASYIDERELDAQFDFPFYFTLRSAFTDWGATLSDVQTEWDASQTAFAGNTMSTFLGNHDVERFATVAHEGALGRCADDTHIWTPATAPDDDAPYDKLKLAWTWLLTHEGLPLIYYGDEIGMPGHGDPDNRQMMRFGGALSGREAGVLDHVKRLGQARLDHPADVWAWARVSTDGGALAIVNRSGTERQLSNGLAWAGLSAGTYLNVLTDDTITSSGDTLTVTVPALGSVVLVKQ
ncbi:MAG: hypothetical protein JRI25_26770, partial [Deltaproteobacteria bacterium]|nr:hypothetical protein [Deltaproteobacteria bacterium]